MSTARGALVASWLGLCLMGAAAQTPPPTPPATPPTPRAAGAPAPTDDECRVAGVRNLVQCGTLEQPLDPARPAGPRITIRYAVVPAMARNKLPDPVFMLAGGPGQSAVALIPTVMPLFQRLNNRRDIVFVDQRGTGGSAPLDCPDDDAQQPLAETSQPERQRAFVRACKAALLKRPHVPTEADLGHYTTWVAMRDVDAVRARLGYERLNIVGGSYGTRAGLEYLRQFPDRVRRLVLDGVAPPDMVLPESAEPDNDAAWQALVRACAAEPACDRAHPGLGGRVQAFLATLPREATARQPMTGAVERFTLTREMVLAAIRGALYAPWLAAALPEAVDRAAAGELEPLVGLGSTLLARRSSRLALGMHLSVVCAEDVPRQRPAPAASAGLFGDAFSRQYQRLCADWPRGAVPDAFYSVSPSPAPVLVLSGGLDPVTPPRHGQRVAGLLGRNARHVVVANAGHGVMAVGCMRDVIGRFIDAATPDAAQAVDAGCAQRVPRPPAFVSVTAAQAAASSARAASATASTAVPASGARR